MPAGIGRSILFSWLTKTSSALPAVRRQCRIERAARHAQDGSDGGDRDGGVAHHRFGFGQRGGVELARPATLSATGEGGLEASLGALTDDLALEPLFECKGLLRSRDSARSSGANIGGKPIADGSEKAGRQVAV